MATDTASNRTATIFDIGGNKYRLITLIDYTRHSNQYINGLSPRAGLAVLHSARAWALMQGRTQVLPEDVQAVLPGVVGHRLHAASDRGRINGVDVAAQLIDAVPIP